MASKSEQKPFQFPVGVSNFQELVTDHYLYVDKTLGIERLLHAGKISVICRPRRFGKTLFMSMLQHFFAENIKGVKTKELFQNSLLAQKYPEVLKEHQGQYPVIFISFKDLKRGSYAEAYEAIQGLLECLFEEHISLLDSKLLSKNEKKRFLKILNKKANLDETINSLKHLTHFLHKVYKKKVIVLIDEHDVPIQEGFLKNYYKKIIDFMRVFLGAVLKDNSCLERGVITGEKNLCSDLDNVEVHSILKNTFIEDFGFTQIEINELLQKTGLSSKLDEIKRWYNGYQIAGHTIYNPWSIISCLKNFGALEPYWVNTSGNELIKKVLIEAKPQVKEKLETLIQERTISCYIDEQFIFDNLANSEIALWTLLLFSGYLTAQNFKLDSVGYYQCEVRIPNQEIKDTQPNSCR